MTISETATHSPVMWINYRESLARLSQTFHELPRDASWRHEGD